MIAQLLGAAIALISLVLVVAEPNATANQVSARNDASQSQNRTEYHVILSPSELRQYVKSPSTNSSALAKVLHSEALRKVTQVIWLGLALAILPVPGTTFIAFPVAVAAVYFGWADKIAELMITCQYKKKAGSAELNATIAKFELTLKQQLENGRFQFKNNGSPIFIETFLTPNSQIQILYRNSTNEFLFAIGHIGVKKSYADGSKPSKQAAFTLIVRCDLHVVLGIPSEVLCDSQPVQLAGNGSLQQLPSKKRIGFIMDTIFYNLRHVEGLIRLAASKKSLPSIQEWTEEQMRLAHDTKSCPVRS